MFLLRNTIVYCLYFNRYNFCFKKWTSRWNYIKINNCCKYCLLLVHVHLLDDKTGEKNHTDKKEKGTKTISRDQNIIKHKKNASILLISTTNKKIKTQQKCDRQQYVIRAVTGNWIHELLSFIWWEKERSFIYELSKYFPAPSDSSSEGVRCGLCGVKGSEPEWFGGHSQYRVSSSSAASNFLIPID